MSKQLKITESKKSEISDASALDLDSDSQPISVAPIAQSNSLNPPVAQQLPKIQQSLDNILLLEFSEIRIQDTENSDDMITQLKHDNFDLRDTIKIVRDLIVNINVISYF